MKKNLFWFVFVLVSKLGFCQNIDSLLVVKQVDSLLDISSKLDDARKYRDALPLVQQAADISKQNWGENNARYATSLHRLGHVYKGLAQDDKAEELYLKAIELRASILGKENLDYAMSLNNLGSLYQEKGYFEKAEALYLESKDIREKVLGKEHPDYASSLNNLAILYWKAGNYEKAEQFYLESKALREKVLGKENADYASSVNNLALLYWKMGNYEKAEALYLESKAIRERVLGKEHPDYATNLNNLAILYRKMGNYEKAEPLYLESKAIQEKVLGKEHPDYAATLSNLANLYRDERNYEKAEQYFLESKAIREKALGKEHPDYASTLNNLANLYRDERNYEKAEPLYLESKAIWEKALGKEHPRYAVSLNNLAEMYRKMGDYEKSEQFYLESKAVQKKVLGGDHPDYAGTLTGLAYLYLKMDDYERAEALFLELSSVNRKLIEKSLHHLTEQELNGYLHLFSDGQSLIFSFAQQTISRKIIPACYDNTLFYKGFLLEAINQVKSLSLADSAAAARYNLLKSYDRRLAVEYAKPIAKRDSANIADLEAKANGMEKDLVRSVAGYREATHQVYWQEVQQSLKVDEASVEFVHYRYYSKQRTDSTMYAALVLRPDWDVPKFIPLFEEKQLDALLQMKGINKNDAVNRLYMAAGQQQQSLYALVWQPLEKELVGIKTIYFSPSSLLHRLNLDAIPVSDTEILADRYSLVQLTSTRQLAAGRRPNVVNNQDALLYGGIQYDLDSAAILQANIGLNIEPLASRGERNFCYSDAAFRGGTWSYLKWTDVEISSTETILSDAGLHPSTLKGYAATEESFKAIGSRKPSPRILHIATHGFFFPDPKSTRDNEPGFKNSDNPMIRSGLILAGGNHAWKTGKPFKPGMEDGILTAYEISQMDLSNTELVVLSACETGLGDIQGNEGVYGLQRAFKIAGVKYLIMSLWQVPDYQTQELMTTFYSLWLDDKMTIPDAFRSTQKAMKDKYKDPFLWAGFVLVE